MAIIIIVPWVMIKGNYNDKGQINQSIVCDVKFGLVAFCWKISVRATIIVQRPMSSIFTKKKYRELQKITECSAV